MHQYPAYSDRQPVRWVWSAQVFRDDSREVYGEGNNVEPLRAIEDAVESWKAQAFRLSLDAAFETTRTQAKAAFDSLSPKEQEILRSRFAKRTP